MQVGEARGSRVMRRRRLLSKAGWAAAWALKIALVGKKWAWNGLKRAVG